MGLNLLVGMVTFGDEWLAAHSLQTLKLTADHVLQKAKVTRFVYGFSDSGACPRIYNFI